MMDRFELFSNNSAEKLNEEVSNKNLSSEQMQKYHLLELYYQTQIYFT